jgi:hypothetical protein
MSVPLLKPVHLPTQDELPYDDGMPMEIHRHRLQMNLLIHSLDEWAAQRRNVFRGGNMFIYFGADQLRGNRPWRRADKLKTARSTPKKPNGRPAMPSSMPGMWNGRPGKRSRGRMPTPGPAGSCRGSGGSALEGIAEARAILRLSSPPPP